MDVRAPSFESLSDVSESYCSTRLLFGALEPTKVDAECASCERAHHGPQHPSQVTRIALADPLFRSLDRRFREQSGRRGDALQTLDFGRTDGLA